MYIAAQHAPRGEISHVSGWLKHNFPPISGLFIQCPGGVSFCCSRASILCFSSVCCSPRSRTHNPTSTEGFALVSAADGMTAGAPSSPSPCSFLSVCLHSFTYINGGKTQVYEAADLRVLRVGQLLPEPPEICPVSKLPAALGRGVCCNVSRCTLSAGHGALPVNIR